MTSWHDYPAALLGQTERALLGWLSREVGRAETWLDVGAHYGYTALALSDLVGPAGRIFAFEPLTRTAGHLDETRWLNRLTQLTVVPIALGDPETMTRIRLATVRGMADRLLTDDASGQPEGDSESIVVSRLDWLWPRIAGQQHEIHGIKIDVQGMELEALRGMAGTLREHTPKLIIEVHQGVNRADVDSLLTQAGYQVPGTPLETEGLGASDQSYYFRPATRVHA